MCEDRVRRMKRDIRLTQRRARRLMRMRLVEAPLSPADSSTSTDSTDSPRSSPAPPQWRPTIIHPKILGSQTGHYATNTNKGLIGIALQTVELMRRNREIQLRLEELRRETSAYMLSMRLMNQAQSSQLPVMTPPGTFVTPPATSESEGTRSLPELDDTNANNSDDVKF